MTCNTAFDPSLDQCPVCHPAPVVVVDPLIGTLFAEKYEIQSVLGKGGMSVVYKARHKYMNRIVAVKLLLEHLSDDPTAFARFQKEAQAASSLSHQNIVSVHDFGVTGHQAYFVMDCLEGDSLYDVIVETDGVPIERAVNIFRQTCEGLSHAHKKGIIHRDLKPSNIVLVKEEDGTETVKIVDFGLAKLHRPEGVEEARLTQSGMVFGSPLYMSPEQCQGYQLDQRSDIYSLGVLMYETLAGKLPFQSDSFFNIALLHIHQEPPKFADTVPEKKVPPSLEEVILKCLEKDVEKRFQAVDDLRQRILDSALISGVPGLKPGAVVVSPSGKQSPFRQTLENMRANIASGATPKKRAVGRTVLLTLASLFLIGSFAWFFMFPGTEGDRGTPYQKLRWQLDLEFAQRTMQQGDYPRANDFMADAKTMAYLFADRHARLRLTLERQAELYNAWGKYADAEKANQDAANIFTEQAIAEADEIKAQFSGFGDKNASESQKQADRMHAIADVNRLVTSAQRVHSRAYYRSEEKLIRSGIDALKRLNLDDTAQMAELDALYSQCLMSQQRMDEVRPYLLDAKNARSKAMKDGSTQSKHKYIRSVLQLGQFDRDQSYFAEATAWLNEAIKLGEKEFPDDKILLADCYNSYADLLRQTNHSEEALIWTRKAKALQVNRY